MQSDQADLRDFNTQMTKPAIADRRITGSANMKIGVFPDVNVTIVDDRTIRDMPDAMIIRPLRRICFIPKSGLTRLVFSCCPIEFVLFQFKNCF